MARAFPVLVSLLLSTALPTLTLGCAVESESTGQSTQDVNADWDRAVVRPATEAVAASSRARCAFSRGALPAETLGAELPIDGEIPIKTIVVLMQENRSFDSYFGHLNQYAHRNDIESPPDTTTNPEKINAPGSPLHAPQHAPMLCMADTNHEWGASHVQVNGGKMDGFFATNEGHHEVPVNGTLDMISGRRAMGYYDATDLPFYYWLASEFSIADHYHCSLQGPTFPNRMFLYAASSFGNTYNTIAEAPNTLVDYLEERQIDWKIYATGTPGLGIFLSTHLKYAGEHLKSIEDYFADAAAGTLPQFAFVDPNIGREGPINDDEHPPSMAPLGEELAARVVDALTKSPNWSKSALFLTYDEHGGLYDHVPPPKACVPDDSPVKLQPGDPDVPFDELGVRVPMMVVSPFAKKHFVSHRTYDHTSIVRFVEAKFVLPALSNRDANAEIPWEMFDFEGAPHADPPKVTIPIVDQAKIDACKAIFEP